MISWHIQYGSWWPTVTLPYHSNKFLLESAGSAANVHNLILRLLWVATQNREKTWDRVHTRLGGVTGSFRALLRKCSPALFSKCRPLLFGRINESPSCHLFSVAKYSLSGSRSPVVVLCLCLPLSKSFHVLAHFFFLFFLLENILAHFLTQEVCEFTLSTAFLCYTHVIPIRYSGGLWIKFQRSKHV